MAGTKCTIELTSGQSMGGEIEFTTECYEGTFMERNGSRYISYVRKTEDGQVSALITLGADNMVITQKGSLNSSLKFVPREMTENEYGTPQGALTLPIFTKKYSLYHLKDGFKIELAYDLVAGAELIQTQMSIIIKMEV